MAQTPSNDLAAGTPPTYPMRRDCPFDPPAELRRIRERSPITQVTLWDGSTPWLVTRYDDVRAVLSDQRFSADSSRPGYPARSAAGRARRQGGGRSFITMDDPDHARYRKALIGEFTVRRTESLRPLVTETVDGLLNTMAESSRPADLIESFALPLPSMVICHLLGVPYTDHRFFQEHSYAMLDLNADPQQAVIASRELSGYLRDLTIAKETDPGEDLIGRLIVNKVRTGEMSRRDVVGMAMLLLIAGHETTANMIALGTLTLLRHPDQAAEIRGTEDPTTVNTAVEELLRLLTITHTGRRRVATEDIALGDMLIRAGEGVIAAAESANRDPARFDHPDVLDIHRRTNHHVAFGFGVHQCLGQPLARLELQIAYPALLRRFPGLRVAVELDDIRFRDEMPVYGVQALPVTW
jgi:cytochrome P450